MTRLSKERKRSVSMVLSLAVVGIFTLYSFVTQGAPAYDDYLTVADEHRPEVLIESEAGRCVARLKNVDASAQLEIPAPCGFVRGGREAVARSFSYKGVGRVYIIAGPVVAEAAYKSEANTHRAKPKHQCSHHGQAIVVGSRELMTRPAEKRELAFCHERGFDEKDYYHYAHTVDEPGD